MIHHLIISLYFLDYYALMFIAAELDTWEYMGGTPFYARAIGKADIGKDSNWSRGWEDRWKKGRKIKNNQYLRNMRFNYFLVQDELKNEKIKGINVTVPFKKSVIPFMDELSSESK